MKATRSIAVTSRSPGNLDVFTLGTDGVVYTSWWYQGQEWSGISQGWRPIGGFFPPGANVVGRAVSQPAPITAIAKTPHSIDLFVVGNDGRVYTSWWNEGHDWSGVHNNWKPIGGFFPAGARVTAVSKSPHSIDLFAVGNDGRVYTSWWNEGHDWSGVHNNWKPIGGFFAPGSQVSATTRHAGNIDLFATKNDGVVYTSWWYEGQEWSGINNNWKAIGGFFPSNASFMGRSLFRACPVTAIAKSPTSIDLFITGGDGRVYTSWWNDGREWSGVHNNWKSLGGFFPVGAPIAATSRSQGNLNLFATDDDGRVHTCSWYEGQEWSGIHDNWRNVGGFFPAGAPVAAVSKSHDSIDLFVTGGDGRVYTSWWDERHDWSGRDDNWRRIANQPSITLRTVQEDQSRHVIVVNGRRFTANQQVRLGYDLFGPNVHQRENLIVTSDGAGRFSYRIAQSGSNISGGHAQAVDVASEEKATDSI